jgi:hypothetical protein
MEGRSPLHNTCSPRHYREQRSRHRYPSSARFPGALSGFGGDLFKQQALASPLSESQRKWLGHWPK